MEYLQEPKGRAPRPEPASAPRKNRRMLTALSLTCRSTLYRRALHGRQYHAYASWNRRMISEPVNHGRISEKGFSYWAQIRLHSGPSTPGGSEGWKTS